jgi:hypothetical protein
MDELTRSDLATPAGWDAVVSFSVVDLLTELSRDGARPTAAGSRNISLGVRSTVWKSMTWRTYAGPGTC